MDFIFNTLLSQFPIRKEKKKKKKILPKVEAGLNDLPEIHTRNLQLNQNQILISGD